jgi:hypothetical protein
MNSRCLCVWSPIPLLLTLAACGGGAPTPTAPSAPQSFLAGTWRGTLTIQPNPTGPQPGSPVSGAVTWTFEVVPQTNLQTFRATIRSENAWLPITMTASTAIIPGNTPPAQISTHGDYTSARGCRGSFGSFGLADATRIDADFTGVDCPVTFTGSVRLTKE